jgi:hypothetical protein
MLGWDFEKGTTRTNSSENAQWNTTNIGTGGVLGDMEAFFAPVEAQKRGSLHLHLLGWLTNVPGPKQLQVMIKDAAFRERLFAFLDRNVYQGFLDKEDFGISNDTAPPRPDAPNDERLCGCDRHAAKARKGTGIKTHVLSQRPPNPDGPDFLHLWIDRCNSLAAKTQTHKCYGDPAERTGCWTITDKDNNPV